MRVRRDGTSSAGLGDFDSPCLESLLDDSDNFCLGDLRTRSRKPDGLLNGSFPVNKPHPDVVREPIAVVAFPGLDVGNDAGGNFFEAVSRKFGNRCRRFGRHSLFGSFAGYSRISERPQYSEFFSKNNRHRATTFRRTILKVTLFPAACEKENRPRLNIIGAGKTCPPSRMHRGRRARRSPR